MTTIEAAIMGSGFQPDTLGTVVFLNGPRDARKVEASRKIGQLVGGPIRIPHYSVSITGIIGELALAAGGTLVLQDAHEFRSSVLETMVTTWRLMYPRARPVIVFDSESARFPKSIGPIDHTVMLESWTVAP